MMSEFRSHFSGPINNHFAVETAVVSYHGVRKLFS